MGNDQNYYIYYELHLKDQQTKFFEFLVDSTALKIINLKKKNLPVWATLNNHQCAFCTLDKALFPNCPICINIAEIIEAFKGVLSSEGCRVRCKTPDRICEKETSIQEALYSIMGLMMALSDCPIIGPLKPLARFHLPFATTEETLFRISSGYLLQQYFKTKNGEPPDFELKHLDTFYTQIQTMNANLLKRIQQIATEDADTNAIVILNSMAQMVSLEINDSLDSIKNLFGM